MTLNLFGMEVNFKKQIIITMTAAVIILSCIAGYAIVKGNKDVIIETQKVDASDTDAVPVQSSLVPEDDGGKKDAEQIEVYVTGSVNKPGIVIINKGDLIDDAIRLAGGVTQNADLGGINLVYEIKENLMLHIKSKKEVQQQADKATDTGEAGPGISIVRDSGGAVVNDNGQDSAKKGKVNLNTASVEELDTLPGIGEATARDIIAYREKNGPFKKIEDVMKVPRIKQSRYSSIRELITVE